MAPSDDSVDRARKRYQRQAEAIYQLQMREAVMRLTVQGYDDATIAEALGQSASTVRRYRKKSMDRIIDHIVVHGDDVIEPPAPPKARIRRGPGSLAAKKRQAARETEEILKIQHKCLQYRKRMVPIRDIARKLGLSIPVVQRHLAEALQQLQSSELAHADMERRLMIEQIDDMIRALFPHTTGGKIRGKSTPLSLEAVDRMVKLMDRKSKLLGLDKTPAVDIVVRLQEIAVRGSYEMAEIQDIAREVLARRNYVLPPQIWEEPGAAQ